MPDPEGRSERFGFAISCARSPKRLQKTPKTKKNEERSEGLDGSMRYFYAAQFCMDESGKNHVTGRCLR